MNIDKIRIQNFKGISSKREFDLRPITLFIGPNSSGKSSVIHTLAAISQTFRLPNNTRPLVLDDELADVHLGRFIEVIHTRKYEDAIRIEIDISNMRIPDFHSKRTKPFKEVAARVSWSFRSTLRTQEVYLDEASYQIDQRRYDLKKATKGYHLTVDGATIGRSFGVNGVFLDDLSTIRLQQGREGMEHFQLMFFQQQLPEALKKIKYLGPFRQSPRRRYPTRGASPVEVGPEGEATITMLANESVQHQSRRHMNEISGWMDAVGLGKKIEVQRLARSDLFDAAVRLSDGEKYPIADLGYGVSQVLPVLAQCSFASEGDTLLFEQPELHLHTIAANKLASVFVEASREKKVRIVAETHSPEFFKRFVTEIREGRMSKNDFAAYRVVREGKESCFHRLEVEDDGEIYANWEKGLSIG